MFDWISDAIDWIGDGISSLWDSTIGGAVDAISDAVWDIMFEWLFNKVYGAVAELFMFIDQSATDLFSLAWVSTFVSLFQALGWMLFVCGLVMAVFDTAMAYESGAANIRQTCVNECDKRLYGGGSLCGSPTAALRAVHSFAGFIFL